VTIQRISRLAAELDKPLSAWFELPWRSHVSLRSVLRLLDARTGSYAEVRPARPGLLRVCAHVPEAAGGSDVTGLRVLLLADLLTRTAELRNLQVLTAVASGDRSSAQLAALERAADALGIHPPAARVGSGDARTSLGGPIDVHFAGDAAGVADRGSGPIAPVGGAHLHRAGDRDEAADDLLAGHEDEPLAVRLALMSVPYHQPADLTEQALADARATVGCWRLRVAHWAESPSRPVPAQIAETARAAFDDLDTVSALGLLRGLADDDSVPAGARFESFLYADRILSLDLPRDIGRISG
jgi:hypothetical protein